MHSITPARQQETRASMHILFSIHTTFVGYGELGSIQADQIATLANKVHGEVK